MISNQSLTCPKGASLTFEIDMDTGSDLTGATAQWALCESWFDGAKVYLTKTGGSDGLFINQDAGVWKIVVNVAPTDTLDIPSGLLYHDCKVILQNGDVEDVANGPFSLDPSANLITNAPVTRNIQSLQTIGKPSQTASIIIGIVADWYIDSVAGSDSNNGTTQETPFATLAAAGTSISANPTKTTIALKRGSLFRASLPGAVTSAVDYGSSSSSIPIIDGSDIVTGWTVNGTQTAVWEKTLTIDTGGRPRIFEDGVLMPWVADLATCAATAGSRVLLNDGGSVTLQMHPTGGGNPNTNGKTYEVTARSSPVNMGDNCILKGVHARRAVSNNGAIQMGRGAFVERCLGVDGSKHNILLGSGTIIDTIAINADATTPTEPSNVFIAGYDSRGLAGQSLTFQRIGFISGAADTDGQASFISHDNSGGSYDAVTAEQIWLRQSGVFGPNASSITIRGYYADQVRVPIGSWFASQITMDFAQIRNTGFGSDIGCNSTVAITNLSPQFFKLRDSALYSEGSNDAWFRLQSGMNGQAITFQNTAFVTSIGASRRHVADEGWSIGSLVSNGNIFTSSPYGCFLAVPSGISYTGNDNVLAKQDGAGANPGTETLVFHGTNVSGLTGWRAASSQDAQSMEVEGQFVGGLFSGTYSAGDYRLAGTGTGAAAAAISAGPQNHWDWNTRTNVSGPPTAWPSAPNTLADAIAYVNNPTAWNWG